MQFQNFTSQQKINFKVQIKQHCLLVIEQRIKTAQTAMQNAQDSANNENKSTAGDKYETARAMGQLDRDMNAKQLKEAQQEHLFLQTKPCCTITSSTSKIVNFFIDVNSN